MQFIDECVVELKAGNGGNGIVSWRKEAHNPYGGPYGGDGGDGGDIILIGDNNINSLNDLHHTKRIKAQNGENGGTKVSTGKSGEHLYIKVPLGTVAIDFETNEVITEIINIGQTFTICNGGKGGHGNWWFKNPENKVPKLHENGDLGECKKVKLVLKYIADIGMVGLPNAGKSTLVSKLTTAHPKVANYQFTTLTPVLGVCEYKNERMVFADIPGLIEGASEGKGLGHEFLRHIERCSILIHMISLNPDDNMDINEAYDVIMSELKLYQRQIINKPIVVVANKIDCDIDNEQINKLKSHLPNVEIIGISALNSINLEELLEKIYQKYIVQKQQKIAELAKQKNKVVKVVEVKKLPDYSKDIKIEKIDEGIFKITSKYLEYWTHKIPLDTSDNIIRYNQKLKNLEIEEKVKQLGGKRGDTMLIYDNELTLD